MANADVRVDMTSAKDERGGMGHFVGQEMPKQGLDGPQSQALDGQGTPVVFQVRTYTCFM